MTTLLLEPNDVLFFRDGRPMSGGLAGHGAAWPLPTVLNGALHAALWRADLAKSSYPHRPARNGTPVSPDRIRHFGSLVSAGPFPVRVESGRAQWFFPRPADVQEAGLPPSLLQPRPLPDKPRERTSSLPEFLPYALARTCEPSKERLERWWSQTAIEAYLGHPASAPIGPSDFRSDGGIFEAETSVGIGMDPATGTQDGERIYAAHYLRLREGWCLGMVAQCHEKGGSDLLASLFSRKNRILVGGQQRVCHVEVTAAASALALPWPVGLSEYKPDPDGKCRVKWILLSPAVWPEIPDRDARGGRLFDKRGEPIQGHPGGWLPNWVAGEADPQAATTVPAGAVRLMDGPGKEKAARKGQNVGMPICARLVAAVVPKAIPVTGYALPNEDTAAPGGPRRTHLAVPEGAVYYFETEEAQGRSAAEHARALAAALNWHGPVGANGQADRTTIRNRRSTLFGEKGFGLGICGRWSLATT